MKKPIEWHEDHWELTKRILGAYGRDCRYILEIGQGRSTEVFAESVQPRKGKVWSMDLSKKVDENEYIVCLIGNSLELPWDRCVDLLYLDGCHKPHHVRQELEKFARFVCPGGYILFDDVRCYEKPRLEGVVDAYCREHDLPWYYAAPEPCGTAVIEVTKRLGTVPITDVSSSTDCDYCGGPS